MKKALMVTGLKLKCIWHWAIFYTRARLGIASTPLEGVDPELLGELFEKELDGHVCEVALAIGYHKNGEDWKHGLPRQDFQKKLS